MLTKSVPYTFTRNGYFYFTRRVPTDLLHFYAEDRVVEGLRTKCAKNAKLQAQQASAKLEAYWASLRVAHSVIPAGCTMHSFRHSMRDRLRAVQCPSDVADQIGGWATDGVGQGYGSGYPIEVLMEWVKKMVAASEVG